MSPRWRGVEFIVYYLVLLKCFKVMCQKGIEITQTYVRSGNRLPGIRPGWMYSGSFVDLSDSQWRSFRESLPLLVAVAAGSSAVSRLVRWFAPRSLPYFLSSFGLCFVAYLHGVKALWPISFASGNYAVAHFLSNRRGRGWPLVLWVANCGALLWAQRNGTRPLGSFAAALAPLDKFRGSARWDTCFNLLVLRMLSFGMDLRWARWQGKAQPASLTIEERIVRHAPIMQHVSGPAVYFAYCFFPPLYLAGPIITYNSFATQVTSDLAMPSLQWKSVVLYAARCVVVLICLEACFSRCAVTHAFHVNAMAVSGAWRARDFEAIEVGVVGFWVLQFMWLKFTAIWRLFRLWALLTGVSPPENMLRCVDNNYDIEGFWKSWHASYNRWLVRYLYVPLGGARTRLLNVWVVFSFVALWHDPDPRLLKWGWLMALFLMPEIGLKWLARAPSVRKWHGATWYRLLCAAAAAGSITVLMSANLVGFVIGADGLRLFLQKIFSREGAPFAAVMFLAFFSAANIMFEIRAEEAVRATASSAAAKK